MTDPTLPGIQAHTVSTPRITTRVLTSGPDDGIPVLFLHGNLSSATWWESTMVALPATYRAIAPDQRGYGDADPASRIDATKGLGDLADDAVTLLDVLGIEHAHLVGNSLGSVVVWRLIAEHPQRWISVTQVDPGSPFGFGSTKDVEGTRCWDDYAGSGAGLINPELLRLLETRDRSTDSMFSPRSMLRNVLQAEPRPLDHEDALVDAMLATHLGDQDYPGDAVPSANWPFVAPGVWGPNNALSPKYTSEAAGVVASDPKPPILWVQGAGDRIVSDTSVTDLGTIGPTGLIPNFPGADIYPPQPMVSQIRHMLDAYSAAGGVYEEVVIDGAGHMPFLERPEEFNAAFHNHLQKERGGTP